MAAQPSDDDVAMMMSLTNVSKSEAIARLKNNNNDVSQAMNEYFDDPTSTAYKWDENPFASDRDGTYAKPGISFQIQGPDVHNSGDYLGGAPSRPPSRTSNKSPLGRTLDMGGRIPDGQLNDLTSHEFPDLDLQKALAESAQEAGLPPQEFGVTSTNSVHFGPVTRETYEHRQWQMVHVPNGSTHGQQRTPKAEDRKRQPGSPAILKPGPDDHRLASLITIYHEIPLAREIFLRKEDLLPDYGHSPQWWGGTSIVRPRDLRRSSGGDASIKQLQYELQRLMAFLDKTDRSYGSVEPLTRLEAVENTQFWDMESKFFEAWSKVDSTTVDAFFSAAVQPHTDESNQDVESEPKQFAILDLNLPNIDDLGESQTLYDLIDTTLWQYSGSEVSNSAYMAHVADIVTFRVRGGPSSRPVIIPEAWSPERYMQSNRDAAVLLRQHQNVFKMRMKEISQLERLLSSVNVPGGRTVKAKDLLEIAFRHDAEIVPVQDVNPNGEHNDSIDMRSGIGASGQNKFDMSKELQSIIASIDRKLIALEEEKQKTLASLKQLSEAGLASGHTSLKSHAPPYKLCGVLTSKDTIYLRVHGEPDLIDMGDDDGAARGGHEPWLEIRYISADQKPVHISLVSTDDVLAATIAESREAILVYANEKALTAPRSPLPDALEAFVRADNLAFSAELPGDREIQDSQGSEPSPVSPGKRKYDESSEGPPGPPPRYEDEPRWGGQSPTRESVVVVSHRELNHSDDDTIDGNTGFPTTYGSGADPLTPTGNDDPEVIVGQDPNELAGLTFPESHSNDSQPSAPEMREKVGMPILTGAAKRPDSVAHAMDSMDVDEGADGRV